MVCPNCGKEIKDEGIKFCPECGRALNGEIRSQQDHESNSTLLRNIMFTFSIVCAFIAVIVFLYGHDVFYDDVWMSSAPSYKFWEYGNGQAVFLIMILHAIILFIIGLCCKKK